MLLGAHESIAGGLEQAVYRGRQATCDTIQIFTKANNQWQAKRLGTDEIDLFFRAIEETGVSVACAHTSYLINIASPDKTLNQKSYISLKEELTRCALLEIPCLVLHPGSHVGSGEETGLNRVVDNINRLYADLSDHRVTLCLETTAGQGTNLGSTFEQLAYLIDRVEDKKRIGVCLDTCHIFAAGYPLSEPTDYRKTMNRFERVIGWKYLKVIHLNDSLKEFASRRDRHEHIGDGFIGREGFRNLLNDFQLKKIPMILETPKGEDLKEDIRNLEILRSLIKS
ncbi:MAG: deoxyribonuclease IV [Candidatus Zixiibacteriota bacterium]